MHVTKAINKLIAIKKENILFAFLVALILMQFVFYFGRVFSNPYLINGDQAFHTSWMYKYGENGFIKNDPLLKYKESLPPLLYKNVFKNLAKISDPVINSKVITLLLIIWWVTVSFLFLQKYLRNIEILFFLLVVTPVGNMSGAHPRSFAMPLLMTYILLIDNQKHLFSSIVAIISAYVYFIIAPIMLTFRLIQLVIQRNILLKNYILITVTGIIVFTSVWFQNELSGVNNQYGPLRGNNIELQADPDLHNLKNNLRYQVDNPLKTYIFRLGAYSYRFYVKPLGQLIPQAKSYKRPFLVCCFLILLFSILTITLKYKYFKKHPLKPLLNLSLSLLIAGTILYFLSIHIPQFMYMPSRYLKFTITISITLLIIGISRSFTKCFLCILSLYMVLVISYRLNSNPGYKNYESFKDLLSLVSSTPDGTMICSDMYTANQIPINCQRSVLFNSKTDYLFKKFWDEQKPKISGYYNLIYCQSIDELYDYIQKYKINYLIINKNYYNKEVKIKEFEPIKTVIETNLCDFDNTLFNTISQEYYCFEDDDFLVLNCDLFMNK